MFSWLFYFENEQTACPQPCHMVLGEFHHFWEVFGTTEGDSTIGEQLYNLKQGKMTIHQYSLQFRTLAAASGWNEASLLTAFRQGLEPKRRLQLAVYDDSYDLERFIQLAIRCSNRLHSCLQDHFPASPTPRYQLSTQLLTTATETLYQVVTITGKPLNRRHVRHSVGPGVITSRIHLFLGPGGFHGRHNFGSSLAGAAQPNPLLVYRGNPPVG